MKVSVFGTGMVGLAHAEKLFELGHEVVVGTNDVEKTIKENGGWFKEHSKVQLLTFPEAADYGEIIFEALRGSGAVKVLKPLANKLAGKILIDISNPLDFSKGMPPSLFVTNTDSLGEQIQNALPKTKVVKSFNTMNASLQVNPNLLAKGDHQIFISGNDVEAKSKVVEILKSYGWKNILDLGDITASRATESLMLVWLRLMDVLKTPMFNYKIIK